MLMLCHPRTCLVLALFLLMAGGCAKHSSGRLLVSQHGSLDGQPVTIWTIDNGHGLKAEVMDHGATLVSLEVERSTGTMDTLILGDDSSGSPTDVREPLGVIIGQDREFNRRVWAGTPFNSTDGLGVRFRLTCPAVEEGHPGRVDVEVDYVLTEDNELRIIMKANSQEVTTFDVNHRAVLDLPDQYSLLAQGQALPVRAKRSANDNATEYILEEAVGQLHLAATLVDSSDDRVMSLWTDRPVLRMERLGGPSTAADMASRSIRISSPSEVDGKQMDGPLVPGKPYRHVIEYRFDPD
tara:strand:+ start:14828 stop:15715 length:888 start_codon:yes stop_codon:yes gene_type:complete